MCVCVEGGGGGVSARARVYVYFNIQLCCQVLIQLHKERFVVPSTLITHANHKTSLNYNNSKHPGKRSPINKHMRYPAGIKLCMSHKNCLFTRFTS